MQQQTNNCMNLLKSLPLLGFSKIQSAELMMSIAGFRF